MFTDTMVPSPPGTLKTYLELFRSVVLSQLNLCDIRHLSLGWGILLFGECP